MRAGAAGLLSVCWIVEDRGGGGGGALPGVVGTAGTLRNPEPGRGGVSGGLGAVEGDEVRGGMAGGA